MKTKHVFGCSSCEQMIQTESEVGHTLACPKCSSIVSVPEPQRELLRQKSRCLELGGQLTFNESHSIDEKCTECDGKGYWSRCLYESGNHIPMDIPDSNAYEGGSCSKCHGRGQIRREYQVPHWELINVCPSCSAELKENVQLESRNEVPYYCVWKCMACGFVFDEISQRIEKYLELMLTPKLESRLNERRSRQLLEEARSKNEEFWLNVVIIIALGIVLMFLAFLCFMRR